MTNPRPWPALVALAALAVGAGSLEGQMRRPTQESAPARWAPVTAGARFGQDTNVNGTVVGVQVRIPVLRDRFLEVMPNADMTSIGSLREYQINLEGIVNLGRRRGGIYFGGGLAWRNTIFDTDDPNAGRTTQAGWSAVVGLRSPARGGAFGVQLENRWVFVDDVLKPRVLTLGVNFPLWGGGRREH